VDPGTEVAVAVPDPVRVAVPDRVGVTVGLVLVAGLSLNGDR
jgi:hypothetical protein